MDPPSSGGDGSGGRSNSVNSMAFCHECGIEIRPLMTPDPTCPRCNGQFVEIIDQNSAQGFQEQANRPFAAVHGDPFPGFQFHTAPLPARGGTAAPPLSFVQGAGSPLPQGLGGLLMAMAGGGRRPSSGADGSSRSPVYHESQAHPPASAANDGDSQRRSSESQTNTRSGSTSFGPFGLQWNVQYGSGGGDPYQRAAQHQAENQRYHQPPTLSNFLRFAFGSGTTDDQPSRNRQGDHDEYFHDDGMGGAGGAADGRHYNHDNRGRYHQPSQSPENESNRRPSAGGANSDLPPELSALRNLFTSLFGEPGAQGMGGGGSLLDFLAAGAQVGGGGGPRGQWGDYVLGQQGLDDIISQLMEQTQGSNAPPPATDDVIDKLERFTLADKERIEKAKNQDCPTCKDDFLPSPPAEGESEEGKQNQGEAEEEGQQEDLISMPCGHIFHVDCLVPWLRLHGTCPVCRISIAKPREEGGSQQANSTSTTNTTSTDTRSAAATDASADPADSVPGSWPSPPNPFTSFFNQLSGRNFARPEETIRVTHDASNTTTTTYHPQPPASTTITSTTYTAPVPAPSDAAGIVDGAGRRSGTGLADVEVVNSIVSSPPIVSDREEFFIPASRAQEGQHSRGRDEVESGETREDMRETLRRAAEARMQGQGGGGEAERRTGRDQGPVLEPDELD